MAIPFLFLFFYRELGRKNHQLISCLLLMSQLGIEPATVWCGGWCSNQGSHTGQAATVQSTSGPPSKGRVGPCTALCSWVWSPLTHNFLMPVPWLPGIARPGWEGLRALCPLGGAHVGGLPRRHHRAHCAATAQMEPCSRAVGSPWAGKSCWQEGTHAAEKWSVAPARPHDSQGLQGSQEKS